MTVKEILEGIRDGDLMIRHKLQQLDTDTEQKLSLLLEVINDKELLLFSDNMDMIRLYYFDRLIMEEAAEKIYISARTAYRRRDKCIELLSALIDRETGADTPPMPS